MEDTDYLAALRDALDGGRLRAELDYGKLDHVDSPLLVEAEKTWWIYGGLFGAIALGLLTDWRYGAGFAAVVVLLYVCVGRRIINRRMRERFRAQAMEDVVVWRKLWRLKGVTLVLGDARCQSPGDSWVRFAMAHFPSGAPAEAPAPKA
ncbi:MAG TPA: hypothetical protein VGO34_02370 [Alphaproteobacteria bacterium]|jgi:hypothetical protein